MTERGENYGIDEARTPIPDLELRKKIAAAEARLAVLAQVVGADFGMKARFGELGKGSFFNPEENSITFDPQILLEGKDYKADFIAGHEGGHRAITRGLEQIGMPREKARELYKKIGFGYLGNCLEDCADNDWVGKLFPKFKEDSDRVYTEQFSQVNIPMTTPEINRLIAQLEYVPKFVSFGSEIIRHWATGRHSEKLDEAVRAALEETGIDARDCYQEIPGSYSKEGERLKKAKERFKIFYERIWPEFEKLIKMDIDEEKLRQLADEMNKQKSISGEKGEGGELSEELSKELADKIEENLRKQLEEISKEIDKLKEQMDKADSQEEKDKIAEQMAKMLGESDSLKSGKKVVAPWDKLSDELKKKLQEIFDKLPREAQKRLTEAAKKQLEELDDKLIKETRGKLAEDVSPPTHEEIILTEEREKAEREEAKKLADQRKREGEQDRKLAENLQAKIEGELSEYDRIYKEIAPLADELFNRVHQIFLPKRHPRWQKGHPTGQRLDLAKVMQFQADRALYGKLWERKTIPHEIDYKFTLLVDLSGSMSRGGKIEQTFRGVILLAEVLNRLGIKAEILGFQDEIIQYKDFHEEMSSSIRKKMLIMLKEVSNRGEHNQANWNSDGYCLGKASDLLTKQKGKDNFLMVFSDGLPVPDPAHDGVEYDLKKTVERIRKNTRQKLIGIGLGPDTEHVSEYYPTSLPRIDLKHLPRLLGDLLEDMIEHPSNYK